MSRNGERETLERFLDPIHLDPVESELEVEAFYTLGRELSFFAQLRLGLVEDLLDGTPDEVSDLYVERGEMWLYAEDIADSHLNFDVGRLNFEDDRRWWWDDDIDAVRVAYETQTVEIAVALARQLGPSRSERRFVEPEDDRVLRVLGEASWKWHENHVLELFALYSDDHSPTPQPGDLVPPDREDESDARLTWIGGRGMGVFDLEERGLLGYWLDAAWVWGDERFLEFEEFSPHRGVVSSLTRRDVQGWAFDAGVNWLLPLAWEPRLYAGYAFGSGGRHSEGGADRSFRQTGIQANEAGFGGVERFPTYGILLDPELSNLGILTLGAGISLFRSQLSRPCLPPLPARRACLPPSQREPGGGPRWASPGPGTRGRPGPRCRGVGTLRVPRGPLGLPHRLRVRTGRGHLELRRLRGLRDQLLSIRGRPRLEP